MEAISLAASLMSLVLGGFAIWLSFQFYTKGKDAETQGARTLEGIRAQTEALQKLTGRWMDRLTRYVTEPKPTDENLLTLVSTIADLPTTILAHLHVQPPPRGEASNEWREELVGDLVSCYIGLYYYTGLTNLSNQALLPEAQEFDPESEGHSLIQRIVDGSAADFRYMENVLGKVDHTMLRASPYQNLLQEAYSTFRPSVRTSAEILSERTTNEETQQPESGS